jgi:hypothetical protein
MTKLRRTTIGLRETTKTKLDSNRAPGQCYDGFLCQLVDLWEKSHTGEKLVTAGSSPRKAKAIS